MLEGSTLDYDVIDKMSEIELWRNYQIFRNWLAIINQKPIVECSEAEINNLRFGLKIKKQLKQVVEENEINMRLP